MTDSDDCADTGKRPGKVLIKRQMCLGNGPIFILVILDHSNDIIDFSDSPCLLIFYIRQPKGHSVAGKISLKKWGFVL